jgi:hypothetical protein
MLNRFVTVLFFLVIILTGNLSLTQSVWAETFVQSNAENRLMLALSVGQAELQKWLPAPWQVSPPPKGPLKGANLFLVFMDWLLIQDPQGKPDQGGNGRFLALAVPAKNMQTGEMSTVIIRGFGVNTHDLPGAYKNAVLATILREQKHEGANQEAGVVDDSWEIRDARGGMIELRVQYQRALLSRGKQELKLYSAVEPNFFRIYRVDAAADIVKSVPTGINRVQKYQIRMTVPELSHLFDGTEQLVGVIVYPLYLRQVFLP